MGLPRELRLRKASEYTRVHEQSRRYDCGFFILKVAEQPDPQDKARLGIIASRKVGRAVVRNRAKRLFREIFRLNVELVPAQWDVILIVRSSYQNQPFEILVERFQNAVRKLSQPKREKL